MGLLMIALAAVAVADSHYTHTLQFNDTLIMLVPLIVISVIIVVVVTLMKS